ncbi:MAG TPA: hypothetical protein VNQ52_09645 [Microbacteriaceae bacterium]|nr:hypothetical protein [Microbacteriaceae bacterium]
MVASLCELDYSALPAGLPAMLTLTYPADWQTVAPSGEEAKKHLSQFVKRYERKWGCRLRSLWKMEFQRRGAPHFHLFLVLPCSPAEFREWVSEVWADVVAHPDAEEREKHRKAGTGLDYSTALKATDPQRLAIYFSKHSAPGGGSKEYQNRPPDLWLASGSVGRFWGYWGLEKATQAVKVSPGDYVKASRLLRKWRRANGKDRPRRVAVERVNQTTGEVRTRYARRRRRRGLSGFVCVPQGSEFASQVAEFLLRDGKAEPRAPAVTYTPVSSATPRPKWRPVFGLLAELGAMVVVLLPIAPYVLRL